MINWIRSNELVFLRGEGVCEKSCYLLEAICRRKHENKLPGKVVHSLVFEIFRNTLDRMTYI